MASSYTYWRVAEAVRDELSSLAEAGVEMYSGLESEDSPGDLAVDLAAIEKRLVKLASQIGANLTPLRKTAQALDAIPGVKV